MKAKIQEIVIAPPDQKVIEYIEYLLERARKGEIQSIAVVGSRGNFVTFNGLEGVEKDVFKIIGEIECLKADIIGLMVDLRSDE